MKKRVGTMPKLSQKQKNDTYIQQLLQNVDSLRKEIGLEPLEWQLQWLDIHNKLIRKHPQINLCLPETESVIKLFELFCHMLQLCIGTSKQRQDYCQQFIDRRVQDRPFLQSCQKLLQCGDLMARRMLEISLQVRTMQLAVKEVNEHMKPYQKKETDQRARQVRASLANLILSKLVDQNKLISDFLVKFIN